MSTSPPPTSEWVAKRLKLDHLNADSFKNGVFLSPMVRSLVSRTLHCVALQ